MTVLLVAADDGLQRRFEATLDDEELNPELCTALFRIFQETLTNVTRHAKATTVWPRCRKQATHGTVPHVSAPAGMRRPPATLCRPARRGTSSGRHADVATAGR